MDEYTPGPWMVNSRYPFWVDGPDGRRVVDLEDTRGPDEAKANARLIAAAPALLAACEMALAHGSSKEYTWRHVRDVLTAASAQARGEDT